jgi:hypothetical protein
VLAGEQQPVIGGEDDPGGGAHGAALSEVAADGAALLVGCRQVQVAAVRPEGAGEGDDLEGALPGGVLGVWVSPSLEQNREHRQAQPVGRLRAGDPERL